MFQKAIYIEIENSTKFKNLPCVKWWKYHIVYLLTMLQNTEALKTYGDNELLNSLCYAAIGDCSVNYTRIYRINMSI